MTIEAAAIISADEKEVLCWHLPEGRSEVGVPDTTSHLLDLLHSSQCMAGTAHSHPGLGVPAPSWEDITTYAAIDKYFRRRFKYWIASMDRAVVVTWCGPRKYDYDVAILDEGKEPGWVTELRRKSQGPDPWPYSESAHGNE